MARYRVIQNSFINGHFLTVGEEVDYAGIPGFNLEPLDDEARSAKEKAGKLARRDVTSRAFQEDLTRPDGAPPQTDEPAADEKSGKKTAAKG
ncbi:hypothetical protein [Bombella mellum]|uniref:Uncharacterized protein n=1 Tax=Bombella mellum TaxID=2039288 RepID=A0ABR5ZRF8_9PROT|nr:hypothetical protein [Bombella mellum]MBA5726911.1 hypothetical protein [Bombella mellum]